MTTTVAFASYASSWQEGPVTVSGQRDDATLLSAPRKPRAIRVEESDISAALRELGQEPAHIRSDEWGSAGGDLALAERQLAPSTPRASIAQSARPLLTDRVRWALDSLLPLVDQVASQYFVSIKRIEIIGFVASDEDAEEVVVRVWADLPEAATLTFWDFLGKSIEIRTPQLPREIIDVAIERISFEVRSVTNGDAF